MGHYAPNSFGYACCHQDGGIVLIARKRHLTSHWPWTPGTGEHAHSMNASHPVKEALFRLSEAEHVPYYRPFPG
eukprot:CAMPEP_0183347968 /NCGR_PEP_ID=MMETSP0164_2-20130417/12632_1 /TAXON_ID=221442 /ORGANISM="Coccolithus pelagicus ssp braarudi, Strain PLY182g" /LENGTH=73 /DNA_ID=CAMNT_0025519489 /DNA_START=38 /DNA_END=259 /DNA_ORIENTATION=-